MFQMIPGKSPSVTTGLLATNLIRSELLTEIFAATAGRLAHKVALDDGCQQLTYGELDHRSNQLAQMLQQAGIGPRDCVGLWMQRSLDLHVGLLGILKAGAAYLPFDAEAPPARIASTLQDCSAQVLLAHQKLLQHALIPWAGRCLAWENLYLNGVTPTPSLLRTATPDDPAYIIYTSGSTGQPKGIAVTHRNVCHWARAENQVLQVQQTDVVYQGFSLAFDMSVEEIWLAYLVGATLWVAPTDLVKAVDRLPGALAAAGISVLHAVPTLLGMLEQEIPSLRLINLGGEVCLPGLVERWSRPGRQIYNTYGPTETTVTATWAECQPGQPMTIGKPLPNYLAYVLDEAMNPVPLEAIGELYIGGPGVTAGYIGRPELTAAKFVRNPFAATAEQAPILYRTGDCVHLDGKGDLVFHSRIDDQVKIRGYRIELGEIEALLTAQPAVKSAAVAVRKEASGVDQLVAFLVLRQEPLWDIAEAKRDLAARLPDYMLPSQYLRVAHLPTLSSGKVDRKSLPTLAAEPLCSPERLRQAPTTATEHELLEAWQELFPQCPVSTADDFFTDLGGHSLLAALLISRLRKRYRQLSVQDLYQYRTISALAAYLAQETTVLEPRTATFQAIPTGRYLACMAGQALGLLVIYGFFSLQWLVPYLTYAGMIAQDHSLWASVAAALVVYSGLIPILLGLSVAVKWLVIGRYRPGNYPLWGFYYWRWWFVRRFQAVMPVQYLTGTPLLGLYYRLLGAHIGEQVYLGHAEIGAPDLVSIGDHSSISYRSILYNCKVEDGLLKIGPITVGAHCFLGSGTVLSDNTVLEDYAELEDLSALPSATRIPTKQIWQGSPARFRTQVDLERLAQPQPVSVAKRRVFAGVFGVLLLLFPVLALLPVFPGFMVLHGLDNDTQGYSFLLLTPALSLLYVLLSATEIVVLRWLLLGRVRVGTYSLYSSFYVRKWLVDQLMELSLSTLHPIYATLYLTPWYRLLGVKLGKGTEVSTASAVTHDLLEIDDESFIADAVILGDPHIRYQRLTLQQTRIGKRSFVGNSALIRDGSTIPDGCLIGCLSQPPQEESLTPGSSWFGTPAMFLPKRQTFTDYPAHLTFNPPPHLIALRLLIEGTRILLPATIVMALSIYFISLMGDFIDTYGWAIAALIFPLLYIGCATVATLVIVALKWLLVGRYRPVAQPMWTPFVWLSELITSTYETLGVSFFLDMLRGTPFLSVFLRLLGSRIGKRVYIDTTDLTEFDVVHIGDDCALNHDCGPQTHLFEDRVMKIGAVVLGDRVVMGALSIVLYDASLEADSWLGPLSMAMKGEQLPAGSAWFGSPARPWN
ncbi:Pls/PosA family non-ribosomal peptide synthetase [Anthocerotibacter panamensis]|uniref:Pls/PosA family non-ribosomal peptide synthetase n=1 Tax=Anthocerotibacter panamensis TaxID=2857077 RepID=UPI0028F4359E|nr:Pls/PosA family non-ribosomal peptide synthetase [Anthocerotibacter panamensis]